MLFRTTEAVVAALAVAAPFEASMMEAGPPSNLHRGQDLDTNDWKERGECYDTETGEIVFAFTSCGSIPMPSESTSGTGTGPVVTAPQSHAVQ